MWAGCSKAAYYPAQLPISLRRWATESQPPRPEKGTGGKEPRVQRGQALGNKNKLGRERSQTPESQLKISHTALWACPVHNSPDAPALARNVQSHDTPWSPPPKKFFFSNNIPQRPPKLEYMEYILYFYSQFFIINLRAFI